MRRRALLGGLLVGLAGCATRDRSAGPTPASASAGTTTGDHPAAATTEGCSPVEPEFEVPTVTRLGTRSEAGAVDVAYRIERAYQDSLDLEPAALPGVPADAGPYDYALTETLAETYTEAGTVSVTVTALVGYTVTTTDENGTLSETSYDKPVAVASYRVSDAGVTRRSGVGERSGQLVCW